MENNKKRDANYWALYITLPIILIVIWEGFSLAGKLTTYTMPAPMTIIETIITYIKDGSLFQDIIISFIRVLEGFLVALVLAFILGIIVSIFQKVEIFTDLVIQILRPIPPIAWIPLAILWFGIGESSKVFIIFFGAFFPIFLNTVEGVKNINPKYFELARVYEVPKLKMIKKIIIPGALPSIMTGIRLGLGNAWVCVVAAEMIGATSGVGFMLANGRSLSRPDVVIIGMLIVGIVGKLMDDVIKFLSKKLITWN